MCYQLYQKVPRKCKISRYEGEEIPEQENEALNFGASPLLQNHLPCITCMGVVRGRQKQVSITFAV